MEKTKVKNFITGTAAVLYMVLLIVFVKDVGAAAAESVKVCLETIIPSLYAFMAVSGYVVSTNLYVVLSKPFAPIARYLFRIPEEYFSVFLIGSVGGYPVGAKLLTELYDNGGIDKRTAEEMLSYCYLAGPAFICGIAGAGLFGSVKAGLVIFAAIATANLMIGVLNGIGKPVPPKRSRKVKLDLSLEKLVQSVSGGAMGMFSICAIIVFFSSIICILEKLGIISFLAKYLAEITNMSYGDANAALRTVIEISNISRLTRGDLRLMPLAAALLSFGGLCVLMQVQGFLRGKLSAKRFYLFRILVIILSYFLCKMYMWIFEVEAVQASVHAEPGVRQSSPIPTLFLLIMTILLLSNISMEKKKKV